MIQGINDKIIAKVMTREKTTSGLIIPDSVQEPQAFCKVISVGNDVDAVKTGDIVVCHIRGGMDVLIDNEIIKTLKNDEVYGILTDKKTLASLKDFTLKSKSTSKIIQLNK